MEREPLSETDARRLVREILTRGRVSFSKHAREEMQKDNMGEVDVVNVLRGGLVQYPEMEKGTWRYRASTRKFTVVFAFRSEEELVVVTAWRVRR